MYKLFDVEFINNNRVASKNFELLCSQRKGELMLHLLIYKISIVVS